MLVSLYDSGGTARRNALAAALGRDRTRLSHLLTRYSPAHRHSGPGPTPAAISVIPGPDAVKQAGGNTVGGYGVVVSG